MFQACLICVEDIADVHDLLGLLWLSCENTGITIH